VACHNSIQTLHEHPSHAPPTVPPSPGFRRADWRQLTWTGPDYTYCGAGLMQQRSCQLWHTLRHRPATTPSTCGTGLCSSCSGCFPTLSPQSCVLLCSRPQKQTQRRVNFTQFVPSSGCRSAASARQGQLQQHTQPGSVLTRALRCAWACPHPWRPAAPGRRALQMLFRQRWPPGSRQSS